MYISLDNGNTLNITDFFVYVNGDVDLEGLKNNLLISGIYVENSLQRHGAHCSFLSFKYADCFTLVHDSCRT